MRMVAIAVFNELIHPIRTDIGNIGSRLRSLYSNGSGGPPGYLETAREQDDERFAALFDMASESKTFAETVKNFINEENKRRAHRQTRVTQAIKVARWALPGVFAAMLTVAGFAYHAITPVAKVLWEDYLRAHPEVTEQLKKITQVDDPAATKAPQDAGLPFHPEKR